MFAPNTAQARTGTEGREGGGVETTVSFQLKTLLKIINLKLATLNLKP